MRFDFIRETKKRADDVNASKAIVTKSGEEGFSLIEVSCASVILLVALLGVAFSFTYAINYNAGNYSRSQSMAVLQQEVENKRSAKFTPAVTDDDLKSNNATSGVTEKAVTDTATGARFKLTITIDNDPFTDGVQTDATVPDPTFKQITITATLASPSPGWQTAIPVTVVLRRTRGN
jgi:prepilin-type N-terminal cleavage/methylation domain-containing protein